MATFAEHALADYALALEESGVDLEIEGETVRCFSPPEECMSGEFERVITVRKQIFHLPGAIDEFVAEQLIEVDGHRWLVISHVTYQFSSSLILERVMG